MMASKELIGMAKQVALREADIEKLQAEIKILVTKGDEMMVNELTAKLEKCEEELLNAHYEYQEALHRLSQAAQNNIIDDILPLLRKHTDLQHFYFLIVNWLCNRHFTDADGKLKTYWAQFHHDYPGVPIWDWYK